MKKVECLPWIPQLEQQAMCKRELFLKPVECCYMKMEVYMSLYSGMSNSRLQREAVSITLTLPFGWIGNYK